MKGISKFFGMFLNIMQIIFIIIGLFAIFINITTFGYSTQFVSGTRESVMVMQAVLSAPCLTVLSADGYPIRALFDETKLRVETLIADAPSCITYRQNVKIVISGHEDPNVIGHEVPIVIGDPTLGTVKFTEYPAALKTTEGMTIPVQVTVSVESESECTKAGQYVCMTGEYGNEVSTTDENSNLLYRGKCVAKDGELVIERVDTANPIENCNTQYNFGTEHNICKCYYNNQESAACYTYTTDWKDVSYYSCTKVT